MSHPVSRHSLPAPLKNLAYDPFLKGVYELISKEYKKRSSPEFPIGKSVLVNWPIRDITAAMSPPRKGYEREFALVYNYCMYEILEFVGMVHVGAGQFIISGNEGSPSWIEYNREASNIILTWQKTSAWKEFLADPYELPPNIGWRRYFSKIGRFPDNTLKLPIIKK